MLEARAPARARPATSAPTRDALRVAFVGQAGAASGGAERTLLAYLACLPRDIAPLAILFEDGPFADELRRLAIPVEIVPAPAAYAAVKRERLRFDALLASIGHAARLARRLRAAGVDVVYSNTLKAHFTCAPAAKLAGIPCVMHVHDLLTGAQLTALRLVAWAGSVERVACARVVAAALALDRTTVSYGPVRLADYADLPDRDAARIGLGFPLDRPVVVLIGRINRWKGHDRFLRIAAAVNAQRPVHFAIVGSPVFRDADFLPELRALARDLRLGDAVSFVPWVSDVRAVYAAADVNANTSTREPFGRSVAEAASAGVPSVVFDDGGAAETIFDRCTGRVVRAGDEAAFARAILEMLESSSDARTRELVRWSARRFDAGALALEIAGVVRRAAGAAR